MKNESKLENKGNGCMAPLLYFGSLGAIFFIGNLLSETNEEFAPKFFGVALVIWFLSPVWLIIPGKNIKETKDNIVALGYLIGLIIVGLIILFIIGAILPSSWIPAGQAGRWPTKHRTDKLIGRTVKKTK